MPSSLTVCCVWVKANVPYGVEYVANLRGMVARHLRKTYRFACLTDRPEQVPFGVDAIAIEHDPKLFGWWAKVQLFNPAHDLSDRVLYLDLDTLIVADLAPIVDYAAPFALVPPGGSFHSAHYRTVRRFNSSVMVWDKGATTRLYTRYTPAVTQEFHGDQDFIGEEFADAATMPADWFPRLSEIRHLPGPPPEAKVVLAKVPKNHIAADLYPWVSDAWRAA